MRKPADIYIRQKIVLFELRRLENDIWGNALG